MSCKCNKMIYLLLTHFIVVLIQTIWEIKNKYTITFLKKTEMESSLDHDMKI